MLDEIMPHRPWFRTHLSRWSPACMLLLCAATAMADSGCGPEARLIGSDATGYVAAQALWTTAADPDTQRPAASDIPNWNRQGRSGPPLRCEDIRTLNQACRGDKAFVPVWGDPASVRIEAHQVSDEPVWLAVDTRDGAGVRPLLALGQRGVLLDSRHSLWRPMPDDFTPPVQPSTQAQRATLEFMLRRDQRTEAELEALLRSEREDPRWAREVQVQAFSQRPDGRWMLLAESWVDTSPTESGATQAGPVLRSGWVRHRDARGVVLAVLQAAGCD
jgi:hypothetical protein